MATRTISNAGGNWNATGTWVEGAVPTAADDVVATATSGNVSVNIATAVCRSLDLTGFTALFDIASGGKTLSIGDSTAPPSNYAVKLPATGFSWTQQGGSKIALVGNSGTTKLVDFGGQSIGNDFEINTTAGTTHQLTGHGLTVAGQFLVNGTSTFDSNNLAMSMFQFTPAAGTSVTFGTSTLTVTGAWNASAAFTLSAASATLNISASTFAVNSSHTYGTITWTITLTSARALTGGTLSCANLTLNQSGGGVSQAPSFSLAGGITCSGTFTVTGGSAFNRPLVFSSVAGTARTITAATVSITNADFADITGAGAGTWSGTVVGDCGGNSGIAFTTPVTRYWVGNAGNWEDTAHWSASSGGSSGASTPLPQDTARIDANSITSASQSITTGSANYRLAKDIDFTGVLNSPTWAFSGTNRRGIYGSLTMASAMSMSQSGGGLDYRGRGSHTITTAGKDMVTTGSATVDCVTGTYTLGGAYTSSAGATPITLTSGTFDAGGYNVTLTNGSFASSNSNTRTLRMGSGTWTIGGSSWNIATSGMTLVAGTSTIAMTDAGTGAKTFGGGGLTYNNLTISGGGTGVVTITGGNTFKDLSVAGPKTVRFSGGTTTTLTGKLLAAGSSGNLVTIDSTTASVFTLSKASGVGSASDYISLAHSTATGGATFYAGSHSTDGGNNTGWSFTDAPPPAQTIAVGSAVEPATAQAVVVRKSAAVGSATEADSPQPALGRKIAPVGSATETDTPEPVTARKTAAVGSAVEPAAAQAVMARKSAAVGSATEADSPQPALGRKIAPVGSATETDTPEPVAARKTAAVGSAVEADTAQATGRTKVQAAGPAGETSIATSVGGSKVLAVGTATEASAAQPAAAGRSRAVGAAVEIDSAPPAGRAKVGAVGAASEVGTAVPAGAAKAAAVGAAVEVAAAGELGHYKVRPVGTATEVDTARSPGRGQLSGIGPAVETTTAWPVTARKIAHVGPAVEAESARPVAGRKLRAVAAAAEVSVAAPSRPARAHRCGPAIETGSAQAVSAVKAPLVAGRARIRVLATPGRVRELSAAARVRRQV